MLKLPYPTPQGSFSSFLLLFAPKEKVHRIFFFLPKLDRKGSGGFFLFPLMFDEGTRLHARPLGACMHGTGTPVENTVALVQLSMFARLRIRDRRIVVGGSDSLEYCRPAHGRFWLSRRRTPLTFGHPCTCAVVLAVSQPVINQAMSMSVKI